MATFNETQKRWVDSFLGKNSGGASESSLVRAANEVVPARDATSGQSIGTNGGKSVSDALKSQGVLMAAVGAPTGGGVGGSTGGGTGGPREKPEIWGVDPDRVLKMNKLGTPVFQSVSTMKASLRLEKKSS